MYSRVEAARSSAKASRCDAESNVTPPTSDVRVGSRTAASGLYRPEHGQRHEGEDHGNSAHGKQKPVRHRLPFAAIIFGARAAKGAPGGLPSPVEATKSGRA